MVPAAEQGHLDLAAAIRRGYHAHGANGGQRGVLEEGSFAGRRGAESRSTSWNRPIPCSGASPRISSWSPRARTPVASPGRSPSNHVLAHGQRTRSTGWCSQRCSATRAATSQRADEVPHGCADCDACPTRHGGPASQMVPMATCDDPGERAELEVVRRRLAGDAAALARPRAGPTRSARWPSTRGGAPPRSPSIRRCCCSARPTPRAGGRRRASRHRPECDRATQRMVRRGGPAYIKLGQFVGSADGILPDASVKPSSWCQR